MYFDLLKVILDPAARYRIYLDYKDTHGGGKVARLHDVLCNNAYDFKRERIERVQIVRSHEVDLIQLCDLLLGIVSYANRDLSTSPAKLELVDHMRRRSRRQPRAPMAGGRGLPRGSVGQGRLSRLGDSVSDPRRPSAKEVRPPVRESTECVMPPRVVRDGIGTTSAHGRLADYIIRRAAQICKFFSLLIATKGSALGPRNYAPDGWLGLPLRGAERRTARGRDDAGPDAKRPRLTAGTSDRRCYRR